MAHILVIDDEVAVVNLLAATCRQKDHTVVTALSAQEALDELKRDTFDLMIVDINLPDSNGLEVVRYGREHAKTTRVIMVTGFGTVESAVEAMRLGAFDYMTKPFEPSDLQKAVELALMEPAPGAAEDAKDEAPELLLPSRGLIGESEKIKAILTTVEKVAKNDLPVLLEGEFGSGKQMVARSIHQASARDSAPFSVLQCSALPEDLLEAELFGTNAPASTAETIFSKSSGGTVFIEEIQVLPLRLQSKLERYLEEVDARRMSGQLPTSMDCRIICSAAKPLQEAMAKGEFREDLYYKISVIPIEMPPLRSRSEDIIPLSQHFVGQYASRTGQDELEIDKYAQRLLESYPWPGNVGELLNAIERACAFAEGGRIRPIDLPAKVTQKVEITDEDEKTTHHLPIGLSLKEYIEKQEKLFVRETLKFNEGSREKAASMLNVSIATLYRKLGLKLEREKLLSRDS
ncbi:MAG: sigma-54 dependent transcriptional regulator [Verrucomicrobiota bacterium]